MYVSDKNFLIMCACPIVQQIVGTASALKNTALIVRDIFLTVFGRGDAEYNKEISIYINLSEPIPLIYQPNKLSS